ncbi:MAG TPA: molecular chaperone HtpG, partial [Segetibacter sp.]
GLFVKYGMMTDDKFLDKANKFLVMEDADTATNSVEAKPEEATSSKKFYTLEEYKMEAETLQKNKDGKVVIIYTTDPVQQDAYIQHAQRKGYKVVKMETLVDAAFINHMETKWENVQFTRVDADIADNLIDKNEDQVSVLSKEEEEKLKGLFGIQVPELNVTVEVKGLSEEAPPVVATRPEFMRRMKDMGSMGGGMASWYAKMPDEVTLTVNGNHKIFQGLLKEDDAIMQEKQVRNLADLALLSQGLLKGNALTSFINRSVELMQGEKKSNLIVSV